MHVIYFTATGHNIPIMANNLGKERRSRMKGECERLAWNLYDWFPYLHNDNYCCERVFKKAIIVW